MAMAMASHGLLTLSILARFPSAAAPSRFTFDAAGAVPPTSFPTCCSGCQLQQLRPSVGLSGKHSKISVGRQLRSGGRFWIHGNVWRLQKSSSIGSRKQQTKVVTEALPTEVAAAGTALVVAGAFFALTRLNKDAVTTALPKKTECGDCGGSGVCPACKGEGFVNKKLSAEAAAKARAGAKDAATRYTAGLAKKWNYCTTCGGGRGCQSCDGKGWIP